MFKIHITFFACRAEKNSKKMLRKRKPLERSRFRSIERVAGGARALSIRTFGRKPSLCIESVLVKFWRNKDASVSRQAGTLLPSSCLENAQKPRPDAARPSAKTRPPGSARSTTKTTLMHSCSKISKCVLVFRKLHNLFASSGRKSE